MTTVTGVPVAAIFWIISSCRPGRAIEARSKPSPSSIPNHNHGGLAFPGKLHRFIDRGSLVLNAMIPHKAEARVAGGLVVLHPDVVRLSLHELVRHRRDRVAHLLPPIEDEFAVDRDPVAVITLDADLQRSRNRSLQSSGPANGIPIKAQRRIRPEQRPAEIDIPVAPCQRRRACESDVREVLAGQASLRRPVRTGIQPGMATTSGLFRPQPRANATRVCLPTHLPDAVEDADLVDPRSAVSAEPRFDGIVTDDRDRGK